jgi:uncharacterized protein (UPF0548 family)
MGKDWSCGWHTEVVFKLKRPMAATIEAQIAAAGELPSDTPALISLECERPSAQLPFGYVRDFSRTRLGSGESVFATAKRAFSRWIMFDLGWVRVANPDAAIAAGQIVAVEAQSLGLWTLSMSRIRGTIDPPGRFGFIYATTARHVEQGEERFLLSLDETTGDVWYELEAVSRPRAALARVGFPITRRFQHRFARDSHRRMREEVSRGVRD